MRASGKKGQKKASQVFKSSVISKQDRTRQNTSEHNRTRQNMTEQDRTGNRIFLHKIILKNYFK